MIPTFKYGDIVIIICTIAFFCSYGLGIIMPILSSQSQEKRFTLVNVAIAFGMGFGGSIFSLILLYWIFGKA
jgi:hypothetical protein